MTDKNKESGEYAVETAMMTLDANREIYARRAAATRLAYGPQHYTSKGMGGGILADYTFGG